MSIADWLIVLLSLGVVSVAAWSSHRVAVNERSLAVSKSGVAHQQVATPFDQSWRVRLSHITASRITCAGVLLAGLTLAWVGQDRLTEHPVARLDYVIWGVGLTLLACITWNTVPMAPTWYRPGSDSGAIDRTTWRIALTVVIAFASILIWQEASVRSKSDASADLVLLWVISIVSLLLIVTLPIADSWERARSFGRERALFVVGGLFVFVLAAVPRFYDLNRYPSRVNGDEALFALAARSTFEGQLRNPFNTGDRGYPSMLSILQGQLMELWGNDIGGARKLSAVLGTLGVVALYALITHHFGVTTGVMASGMAAAFSSHIFWSRDAQNASAPLLFFPLALLFLDKGFAGKSRVNCVLAGMAIGVAQFFHPANRLLFVLIPAYAAWMVVHQIPRARSEIQASVRESVRLIAWTLFAAIVVALPQLSYYASHREEYWGRINQVSVFESGWLTLKQEQTGQSALSIMLDQVFYAAMLPISTIPHGLHFRPVAPLVGWPMAIPAALGCLLVTCGFWKRQFFGLAIAYWLVVAGLAFTEGGLGGPQTNRFTAGLPFLPAFAGIGLGALAGMLVKLLRFPRITAFSLVILTSVLISSWHLNNAFGVPHHYTVNSDFTTELGFDVGERAAKLGPGATVLLGGTPRMFFNGLDVIRFVAPEATGADIPEPLDANSAPLLLTGPTLFVFTPERANELAIVEQMFPNGVREDRFLPDGELLYVSYLVAG